MSASRDQRQKRLVFDVGANSIAKNFRRSFAHRFLHIRHHTTVNLKPPFWKRYPFLIASIGIVVFIGGYFLQHFLTKAEVADFYPSTCLGTWQNPQNAQGKPETSNTGTAFSDTNTATFQGSSTQVYCGGFLPPEYAAKGIVSSAGLTLVWHVGDLAVPSSSVPDAASSSEGLATSTATSTLPTDASSTPSSTALLLPRSPWGAFIALAHAQDASPSSSVTADTSSTPGADASTTSASSSSDTASSTPAIVIAPPPLPDDTFLKVSYSTNGTDWFELARINEHNWQSFTINLPITDWDSLRTLQVKIEGIPTTLSAVPPVYLDGMLAEVTYTTDVSINKIARTPNTLHLSDANAVIGKEIRLTGAKPGSKIEIYWLDNPEAASPANAYAIQVGDDGTVAIDSNTLGPGHYIFMNTLEPDGCGAYSLAECRAREDYIDEIPFYAMTSLPEETSSSVAIASSSVEQSSAVFLPAPDAASSSASPSPTTTVQPVAPDIAPSSTAAPLSTVPMTATSTAPLSATSTDVLRATAPTDTTTTIYSAPSDASSSAATVTTTP